MIVTALMELLKGFLLFVIGLLPTFPDMSGFGTSLLPVVQLYTNIDSFISVNLVGSCIFFLFLFSNAELIWSIIMWVIRKIPGVS